MKFISFFFIIAMSVNAKDLTLNFKEKVTYNNEVYILTDYNNSLCPPKVMCESAGSITFNIVHSKKKYPVEFFPGGETLPVKVNKRVFHLKSFDMNKKKALFKID